MDKTALTLIAIGFVGFVAVTQILGDEGGLTFRASPKIHLVQDHKPISLNFQRSPAFNRLSVDGPKNVESIQARSRNPLSDKDQSIRLWLKEVGDMKLFNSWAIRSKV